MAHVPASNAFIDGALRGGGAVLVHCFAGQSRSAALVMAYLMEAAGRSMMQAWDAARAARPCAHPNPGAARCAVAVLCCAVVARLLGSRAAVCA